MSRLQIVHTTGFHYAGAVAASYNEARMLPQTSGPQLVLEARLNIEPHATVLTYQDYWGTKVSAFEVLAPHDRLQLTATSLVEVQEHPYKPGALDWAELTALAGRQVSIQQQLEQTDRTRPAAEVRDLARDLAEGVAPGEAAEQICRAVGSRVNYVPGATSVFTRAEDAWQAGAGVCQDMAHIAIGALRAVGIPARYVSGYLHPDTQAPVGTAVEGESHAWVEWFTGDWVGFDPTNAKPAGADHVVVGCGRDYDDVPPLRGVYAGPFAADQFVNVRITRVA
jgi:transglutaminase-like putative cysteine protease